VDKVKHRERVVKHRECVVRGAVSSEHVVQLFDTPESLGDAVGSFFHDGLAEGGRLLLVAKRENARRIGTALRARGWEPDAAVADGRMVVLDAVSTLAELGGSRWLSRHLFDDLIGGRVRQLCDGSPLRIYGELVELLAEQGEPEAALQLEEFWNGLSEECSFKLLCGYSSAHFASPNTESILQRICRAHTASRSTLDDTLGDWLLTTRS
jgi:hypothetical protein